MTVQISSNQLVSWVHRLTHFVAWLSVVIFNFAFLNIILLVLYLSGTTGQDIYNQILALGGSLGFSTASQALSFFGVSGFALLSAYAVALKKILLNLSLRYILIKTKERNIA